MEVTLDPLVSPDDVAWCARLMATNEPWVTLRRDYQACVTALTNPAKERYVVRTGCERVGLLILDLAGPFPGYIQTIGLAREARGRGIGSRVLAMAEERIFRDSPNAFLC